VNGHTTAAPPRDVMNSRRFRTRNFSRAMADTQFVRTGN
jgi:hypothetical protein